MSEDHCIKCGAIISKTSTTGRPLCYCSTACRRASGYEIERINKRLAGLESDLINEKIHKSKNVNAFGERYSERVAGLEAAILESEARLKCLLTAKND